jgi:hypothetical protein
MHQQLAKKSSNYIFNKYFYEMIDCIYNNVGDDDLKTRITSTHKVKNNNTLKNTDFLKKKWQECPQIFEELVSSGELPSTYHLCQNGITVEEVFEKLSKPELQISIKVYVYLMSALFHVFLMEDQEDADIMLKIVLQVIKKVQNGEEIETDLHSMYDEKLRSILKHFNTYSQEESKILPKDEGNKYDEKDKQDEDEADAINNLPESIRNSQIGKMGLDIFKECFDGKDISKNPQNIEEFLKPDRLKDMFGKTAKYFQNKNGQGDLDFGKMLQECGSIFKDFTSAGGPTGGGMSGQPSFDLEQIKNMLSK